MFVNGFYTASFVFFCTVFVLFHHVISKDGDDPRNAYVWQAWKWWMNEYVIMNKMRTLFVDEPDIVVYYNSYLNTAITLKY